VAVVARIAIGKRADAPFAEAGDSVEQKPTAHRRFVMTTVVAAIDNTAAARPVLAAAAAFANLLDAEVEAVHAREDGERMARAAAEAAGVPLRTLPAPVVAALQEEAGTADVAAVVVGARAHRVGRRPAGHVALRLAASLPKPLVVVPPDARIAGAFASILVPLNGTRTTAAALAETLALARQHELDVTVLHVHELASLPLFTDQPQHELRAWAQEFLQRHCTHPEQVRLVTRVGLPGQHLLALADEIESDLIALGWAQDLTEGRAAVVREALERSRVPVLLVPVTVPVATAAIAQPEAEPVESRSLTATGLGRA
jgi:nucleotide-binding universal stress UspA family protein